MNFSLSRYEDFVVHEINKRNEVVKLTSVEQPENVMVHKEEASVNLDCVKLDKTILEDISNLSQNHNDAKPVVFPIEDLTKEERTQIHIYIRQNFKRLDTKTEVIDGKNHIRVVYQTNNRNQRNNNREKWPKNQPDYVHFVLYKENMETVQVVKELARLLGSTTKNFSFAGNKDKRAITTQMFCAWKTSPHLIHKAVKDFCWRSRGKIQMKVGHFTYQPEPLKLGDLNGNYFEILLRNVRLVKNIDAPLEKECLEDLKKNVLNACESAKHVGFINYFGMQRFGSHRIDSHKLGVLILRKNFKQLVEEILVEKPNFGHLPKRRDDVSFNDAIRTWKDTGDASLAYSKLSYKYSLEGSLLKALAKGNGKDYHGALCAGMMRNSRLMYLHAYQSYVWNRMASFRVSELGFKVLVGDLVLAASEDLNEPLEDPIENEEDETEESATINPAIKSNIPAEAIVTVTSDNIDQFTIYDVVLPIIGGLSKLPQNQQMADFINRIMEEDEISIQDFASLSKQWCVNGSYRKLLVQTPDLQWEWVQYTDDTKPMILTDLDLIKKAKQKLVTNPEGDIAVVPEQGQQIGLKLSVTLPTSSYATVLLRELTKVSSMSLENKPWQLNGSTDNEEQDPVENYV